MSDQQPKSKRITVLLVDDHPLTRDGLQRALELEKDIKVIGHCERGEDAIKFVRQQVPDVIILDVNLPDTNGVRVARQLQIERHHVAVIMLTAYHEEQQVIHAMRAGARAYCSKTITPDDIIATVRDVLRGIYVVEDRRLSERELESWINEQIQRMSRSTYTIDPEEHYIPLSPRETEILQLVTNGLSNKEIALHLGISQQTVKNHMTSILTKLNVEDRTQAVVTALKHGWVRNP